MTAVRPKAVMLDQRVGRKPYVLCGCNLIEQAVHWLTFGLGIQCLHRKRAGMIAESLAICSFIRASSINWPTSVLKKILKTGNICEQGASVRNDCPNAHGPLNSHGNLQRYGIGATVTDNNHNRWTLLGQELLSEQDQLRRVRQTGCRPCAAGMGMPFANIR